MSVSSWKFNYAITRKPGNSVVHGLRAVDTGSPNLDIMLADHAAYIAVLREAGANVIELPELEDYPDAVFVEDTALCLKEGAVLMKPGALSRQGEVANMESTLRELYSDVRAINGQGLIEGGDILRTGREILIGRSARTDKAGIAELREIVAEWGYNVREVATPEGVLHFKTDCSLLDAETILSTKRLDNSGCFEGYKVIHTADGEEAAANTIRFNQFVVMPAGYVKTARILRNEGFEVKEINNSECAKIDGGMSCLSLRLPIR